MEVYATDTLYVVNAGREYQATPPLTTNLTTHVPTAVKTTHPIPVHVQSGKKKKKS